MVVESPPLPPTCGHLRGHRAPDRLVHGRDRRPPGPAPLAGAAPVLGAHRRRADRMDRHPPVAAQGRPPRRTPYVTCGYWDATHDVAIADATPGGSRTPISAPTRGHCSPPRPSRSATTSTPSGPVGRRARLGRAPPGAVAAADRGRPHGDRPARLEGRAWIMAACRLPNPSDAARPGCSWWVPWNPRSRRGCARRGTPPAPSATRSGRGGARGGARRPGDRRPRARGARRGGRVPGAARGARADRPVAAGHHRRREGKGRDNEGWGGWCGRRR